MNSAGTANCSTIPELPVSVVNSSSTACRREYPSSTLRVPLEYPVSTPRVARERCEQQQHSLHTPIHVRGCGRDCVRGFV
jgi:hypothetical protein